MDVERRESVVGTLPIRTVESLCHCPSSYGGIGKSVPETTNVLVT